MCSDPQAVELALLDVGLSSEASAAFAAWACAQPDEGLVALRPGDLPASIDDRLGVLLAATQAGLVQMQLSCTCSWCGAIALRADRLCSVPPVFRCESCALDQDAELDGAIEVLFRPTTRLREVPALDPAALHAGTRFRLHHFHPLALAPDGVPYAEAVPASLAWIGDLAPGDAGSIPIEGADGDTLEIVALPGGGAHVLVVDETAGPPDEVLLRDGFERADQRAASGTLSVRNAGDGPVAVCALWIARDGRRLQPVRLREHSPARAAYLHPRARRELAAAIRPDQPLGIRDATVWFSDLKGSTAAYGSLGDLEAWRRVNAHFSTVKRVVETHGGTVIKTLGDAVMAVFARPDQAVGAAVALSGEQTELPFRVSLHRGPVLAVDSGGLPDVYGKTVNLASRLEAFAEPGGVCVTARLLEAVPDAFEGWSRRPIRVRVKGIEQPVDVVLIDP